MHWLEDIVKFYITFSWVDSSFNNLQNSTISGYIESSVILVLYMYSCHTQHFESDDPELYKSKIRYIIENDVSDFDLFFSEEVYLPNGKLHQVSCRAIFRDF